jgi:hypothetical protein
MLRRFENSLSSKAHRPVRVTATPPWLRAPTGRPVALDREADQRMQHPRLDGPHPASGPNRRPNKNANGSMATRPAATGTTRNRAELKPRLSVHRRAPPKASGRDSGPLDLLSFSWKGRGEGGGGGTEEPAGGGPGDVGSRSRRCPALRPLQEKGTTRRFEAQPAHWPPMRPYFLSLR